MQDPNDRIMRQGCGLAEDIRLQYLKAMEIQPWSLKHQPDVAVAAETALLAEAEVVAHVDEECRIEPGQTDPVVNPVATDISSFGWEQLKQAVSQCQLCELHTLRTQTVFGAGNPDADLMIIGEAPGEEEDHQGEPFVGPAGQLLDAMLRAIGLDRQKVYIANVLKCRTPENRKPHTSEIVCCDSYLQQQIKLVEPRLILALGRIAAQHLLVSHESLAALREKKHSYNGIPLRVSYHPAYLLRKPIVKRKSWQDLLEIKQLLDNS